MSYTALHSGWTVRAVSGPVPAGISAHRHPGDRARMRAHRPARRRPDRRPVRRGQRGRSAVDRRHHLAIRERLRLGRRRRARDTTWSPAGLDTIATIEVNGVVVGRTENQHRSYRFDIAGVLLAGRNTIAVEFAAPVPTAQRAVHRARTPPTCEPPPVQRACARWPATSAGTGASTSPPAASGRPSASRAGPACGSRRSGRWSTSTATPEFSPPMSTSNGRHRVAPREITVTVAGQQADDRHRHHRRNRGAAGAGRRRVVADRARRAAAVRRRGQRHRAGTPVGPRRRPGPAGSGSAPSNSTSIPTTAEHPSRSG